jgi:hypothetical protein
MCFIIKIEYEKNRNETMTFITSEDKTEPFPILSRVPYLLLTYRHRCQCMKSIYSYILIFHTPHFLFWIYVIVYIKDNKQEKTVLMR